MEVINDIARLSEDDILAITEAISDYLEDIGLDDIEIDEDCSSYSCEGDEVEVFPGIMAYVSWSADYWYKEWTETWYGPYCTPSFSEGEVELVWCENVDLCHEEYDIENVEEISKQICDAVYNRQKKIYDHYIARKKAAQEKKLAEQRARYEAQRLERLEKQAM